MNFIVLPNANPKIYVSEFNNNSVVIKLEYKNFSCLYSGDIETGRENQLVKISSNNLESDIIKIPHHGSSTSSNLAFIKKVNPKVAIISCGQNNSYGHPNIKTLERLEKNGIDIYRTDINGTILINTDGYNYEVMVEKSSSRKISKKVININLATLEDFIQLLGIDEMIANNILLYRTLNKGFKYPEEINIFHRKMLLGVEDYQELNKIGNEEVLGKDCAIYEVKTDKFTNKLWVWNNLILKSEMSGSVAFEKEAVEIKINDKIPDSLFQIPSEIDIVDRT